MLTFTSAVGDITYFCMSYHKATVKFSSNTTVLVFEKISIEYAHHHQVSKNR